MHIIVARSMLSVEYLTPIAHVEADGEQQPFFGAMGCTAAIVFACFGASYGTAKSGVGITASLVTRPDMFAKSQSSAYPHCYGPRLTADRHHAHNHVWYPGHIRPCRFRHDCRQYQGAASTLYRLRPVGSRPQRWVVGTRSWVNYQLLLSTQNRILTCSSFSIGIVGDAGVRGMAQQPRSFAPMVLILIFAEVLGTTLSESRPFVR